MDFEKLGSFYLGKEFDVESDKLLDQLVLYDARDLTTHAVCVGMTGSGKTGLCIDLLEEAALDRVPAIIIDPKGDITNLLLQFPELRPEDFRPWINPDDARRKGKSLDQYAVGQADLWTKGLQEWGQSRERIRNLSESAEFAIFTPGSEAGLPVSVLHSFECPKLDWSADEELLRGRIEGTVSAILGLISIESDPIQSREHILLSSIFEHFWRAGEDLDIRKLILSIQNPPIRQLGVFEIDTFFPPKERFQLAMTLNNIIASPSFGTWLTGEPMDLPRFLASDSGKPRHSIFYLAHLNDTERMFFVTMLLNQLISWMRTQPGTTSLRALVYMDEIFGFFPPVSSPPSKKPMLTLLKQARAYGVGVLLATQNPIDLDYKGLTNAGTWLIGRLQTERDKKRVLDGLESVGGGLDRSRLDKMISKLGKRVFLLHNVHEAEPVAFQTRWAMSYLRGPLTRTQIGQLKPGFTKETSFSPASEAGTETADRGFASTLAGEYSSSPPALGLEVQQLYLPVRKSSSSALFELESREAGLTRGAESTLFYRPVVVGSGRVHFVDRRRSVDQSQEVRLIASIPETLSALRWDDSEALGHDFELFSRPEPEALFESVPEVLNEVKEFRSAQKDLSDHLYRTCVLKLLFNPALKEYSKPGEDEREFRMRLSQSARERRDDEVDKLTERYEKRLARLQDRIKRAELALEKKKETESSRNREFVVSVGESVLGMFLGRRSIRTASSSLGRYRMKSTARIASQEAEEKLEALEREAEEMRSELEEGVNKITEHWDEILGEFEEFAVTPRRSDIEVDAVTIGWEPSWLITGENWKKVVPAR